MSKSNLVGIMAALQGLLDSYQIQPGGQAEIVVKQCIAELGQEIAAPDTAPA
ncbi:MAG: hypothetical protein JO002_13740, partial [Burkholderiaceae bacterium]|nr:hypothetical protein [Burkholderiaceae bacterium]